MVRAIDSIEDVLEHITSDLWQKKHELRRLTDGEFDPVLVFEVERVMALFGIAANLAHDAAHTRRRRLGWERPEPKPEVKYIQVNHLGGDEVCGVCLEPIGELPWFGVREDGEVVAHICSRCHNTNEQLGEYLLSRDSA